ncbi:hypothetical protein [Cryobacterium ruanii]|uniref:Uncharacterized protein n=1 Tax=Cryobacterium ruanii TaxID=1259197 RepID=A0A4R9AP93_9MICO|nr:hypothetical protein [Cryobacterium ruanii]TFD65701.1 hypothetical protein E3T47_09155 [Cryobacterium ruanii]
MPCSTAACSTGNFDGILTTDERAELVDVANLLDIAADSLDSALDQPEQAIVVASTRHYISRLCPQLVLVPLRIVKCDSRSRARPGVDTSMGGQAGQAFYFSPVTAAETTRA